MLFTLTCHDKPEHLPLRITTRPAHIAYVDEFLANLVVAGPMLGPDGQPCGSLFVVDFPDRTAVETFAAGDPYAKAGLFQSTAITGYRMVFKDGAPI